MSNGQCLECEKQKAAAYYLKNQDARKEYDRQYYASNKSKCRETRKAYLASNSNVVRDWRIQNPERASLSNKNWRKQNKELVCALATKRYHSKLKRTPKWADLQSIIKFYINCPNEHHVDHIIPIQGKLVSGLHVENNLQYLQADVNISKGNKFDPWTWEEPICSNL